MPSLGVLLGGLLIGLLLGLLGGGGAILTVPLLVHVQGLEPRAAIPAALLVVLVTAIAALGPHARAGNVRWATGLVFGGAGVLGAHTGGRLAGLVPERGLLLLFSLVMLVTSVALLRCRTCDGEAEEARRASPGATLRLALTGALVGLLVGTVGVGGGFLIVPILNLVAGQSTRTAVGTSMLIIALNSAAGLSGHLAHARIDVAVALPLVALAVIGSQIGARLSPRLPMRTLRRGFAAIVCALALFQLARLA